MIRIAPILAGSCVAVLVAGLAVFPDTFSDPHSNDLTAYWAAGRLNLHGRNPYDARNLLEVEREIGWQKPHPLMLWNPPWALGPTMALGALDFTFARNLWLVLQLALTLGCGIALWRYYRGPAEFDWVCVPLTLIFAPLVLSMKYGQVGPVCLLGLTGFLWLERNRRDLLAGAVLSLAAMKPHLVYMVWPAVLVWSIASRRWKIALGLLGAGLALAAVPLLTNPGVYGDYIAMMTTPPPPELAKLFIKNQDSPTFGWQLRQLLGEDRFSLQYVPTLLGLVWLAWYGWRHRRAWKWERQMPVLLLASICTAAYGAWPADSLLLLPAVIAVAATVAVRNERSEIVLATGVLVLLTLATFAIERRRTTEAYVLVPPLYFAAYLYFLRRDPP